MKIAIPYQDGMVFPHFGRSEFFLIAEVEDGKVIAKNIIGNGGNSHGAIAAYLDGLETDIILCTGMGEPMQKRMEGFGIDVYMGCQGSAEDILQEYLDGTLQNNPDIICPCRHDMLA